MKPSEKPKSATVRLGDLAHCRSGDKGNAANIGIVANKASEWAEALP